MMENTGKKLTDTLNEINKKEMMENNGYASGVRIAAAETERAIEKGAVKGYKAIEKGTVQGYKAIEDTVVGTYKKIEDKFVDLFLKQEGETIEEAKKRINGNLDRSQNNE